MVRIVGRYEQLNENMNRFDDPIYNGHVCVRLEDKFSVALESAKYKIGIRTPEEIARFEGKRVAVVGTLAAPILGGTTAQLVIPSITKVQSIEWFE